MGQVTFLVPQTMKNAEVMWYYIYNVAVCAVMFGRWKEGGVRSCL
jgi:hypothetical protein